MISLRFATINDAHLIWEMLNDYEVRIAAFSNKYITWHEHLKWYQNSLDNYKRKLFIVEDTSCNIIGQVRFDINNKNVEVSIIIDKKFRGMGFGAKAIHKGCIYMKNKGFNYFIASVKKNNIASIKAFIKAGFIKYSEKNINNSIVFIFILKMNHQFANDII